TYILLFPYPAPSLSSFSFLCSLPHRYLHSFPTRRSSDLSAFNRASAPPGAELCHAILRLEEISFSLPVKIGKGTRSIRAGCSVRSEEHTSELQSRFDLVCRLLLEKKKNEQKSR